jgi:hypothetical protein
VTTRPRRDPAIDALRAVAIVGVVSGHWLVTAVVARPDGGLAAASPLAGMPALAPVTWLFQTLGLLFFVAGYAAARARADRQARPGARAAGPGSGRSARPGSGRSARPGPGRSTRPGARAGRLLRPVGALLAVWTVALSTAALAGAPAGSLWTLAKLVVSPLWFLAVLLVLGALTGPLRRLAGLPGALPALACAGVTAVAAADAGLFTGRLAGPVTTLVAWLVPYAFGVAAADGRLGRRGIAWTLLLGGAAAVAGLVALAGYPASAVGVPGDGRSNLDPPSLAAVALALAQVGAALLVRRPLARWWATRPGRADPARPAALARRAVARVNGACLGIYLWHQTALLLVTVTAARLAGTADGLHTPPAGPDWLTARLLWLPVFAVALWAILTVVGMGNGGEHAGASPRGGPPGHVYAVGRLRPGAIAPTNLRR